MSLSRTAALSFVLAGCLAGFCGSVRGAPTNGAVQKVGAASPERMYASAWGGQTHPDLAAFDSWTRAAVFARGRPGPVPVAEGIRLAEVRRAVMIKLMRVDPARALAAAVPETVRAVLPAEVLAHLETPFSQIGDFTVTALRSASADVDEGSATRRREIVLAGGGVHETHVYGRRLALETRRGGLLSGIVLGSESVLEDVTASEAIDVAAGRSAGEAVGPAGGVLGLAPVINSPSTAFGFATQGFTYQTTATNSLSRFSATNLPAGLRIDQGTGLVTGAPETPGIYLLSVAATNGQGTGSSTVRITVYSDDDAPVVLSGTTARAYVGRPFSYQIVGVNSPTSYDAPGLPAGLSIDGVTGLISGTPTAAAVIRITLSATNAKGTGRASLLLYVEAVAPVPSANDHFAAARFLPGTAGSATDNNTAATREAGEPEHAGNAGSRSLWYTWTAPVNGPVVFDTLGSTFDTLLAVYDGDAVTSLSVIGESDDFTYYGKVGRVDFQAQAGVTYRIAVDGFDGESGLVSLQYRQVTNAAPRIISPLGINAVPGESFFYQIAGTNDPFTFAAVGLPFGLGIDPTSGAIVGMTGDEGTYSVTIGAANFNGQGTATLRLTVGPAAPPVISSAGTAKARIGTAFNYQVTAMNRPATYRATGLPGGVQINAATGLISGTPTVVGSFTIRLGATNTRGTGTKTLVLTVDDLPTVSFVLPGGNGGNRAQLLEGGTKLKVQIVRTGGDLSQPLTVNYKPKGGNVPGQDYRLLSGTATIPAGAVGVKTKVKAINDGEADGNKTLKLKLVPSADGSYKIGAPQQVKIRIIDP